MSNKISACGIRTVIEEKRPVLLPVPQKRSIDPGILIKDHQTTIGCPKGECVLKSEPSKDGGGLDVAWVTLYATLLGLL